MEPQKERLIREKLANMENYIQELEEYFPDTLKEYLKSKPTRRLVERAAQMVVESAIDTNSMLVEAAGQVPPSSAYESFVMTQELGAINEYLMARFQRYVGMRNRIVHDYDVLDHKTVFYAVRRLLKDAPTYIRSVRRYLSKSAG